MSLPLLNRLTLDHWRADLRGGLRAAAVALPMGLAFGVVSGAGPVAGIYSAVWTGLCAALFGGTATQISGPTGPIAIVMAGIFAGFANMPAAAFAVIILAGLMQLVLGALRFGRYISLMPYPVTSGFNTGVGCIIIVMQINPMLGHNAVETTLGAVGAIPQSLAELDLRCIAIALGCLAACHWMPIGMRRTLPAHLSVLVVASITVAAFNLQVPKLSAPQSLLPDFIWPSLSELPWNEMWVAAAVLALISSLDSLVTSMTADNATQRFHDSDKELLGQGIGNIVAGLLGALPGAGSAFRTLANIRGGGITPLSGVIHSLFLLSLLLAAGTLIRHVPSSVLAGILIYIGLGIVDWNYIRRFNRAPRGGVSIMVIVWLVAVFINVVTAVAIGIVMASLGFVKRMADLQLESIQVGVDDAAAQRFTADEQAAYDHSGGKTLYIRLSGPLTFGVARGLTQRVANLAGYRSVILDVTDVLHLDESAIVALEGIIRRARDNRQEVIFAGLKPKLLRAFQSFGLFSLINECQRFERRLDALQHARDLAAGAEHED